MALAPLRSPSVLTTAVSDVEDSFSQISLTSDANEDPIKLDPKRDWREISEMVSHVSGNLSKLKSTDFESLVKIAPEVESLELQCALEMPAELFALFRNVKRLFIQKVDDKTVEALKEISSLRRLILRSCEKVTVRGMLHLGLHPTLETLHMYDCSEVNAGILQLNSLTNLRKLTFSTSAILTERELLPLFSRLTKLEIVEIKRCQFKVAAGGEFQRALMAMKSLKVIKIRKIVWELNPYDFIGNVLQYHPTLQKINKISYQRHTDDTFVQWLDTLDPNIENFVATGCFRVHTPSLAVLFQKFKKLKTVELHNCSQFDYRGLSSLTKLLTGQKIELFGCKLCEPAAMEYAAGAIIINQINANSGNFVTAIQKEKSMPVKSERIEKKMPEIL